MVSTHAKRFEPELGIRRRVLGVLMKNDQLALSEERTLELGRALTVQEAFLKRASFARERCKVFCARNEEHEVAMSRTLRAPR